MEQPEHRLATGPASKVYVNGELVAEHAGDPKRPLTGPIGLQLHDQTSFVMFRNIYLLER